MRIRNKWRTGKIRTQDESATAAAYIIWQIGLHYSKNLHQEKFDYESDAQRCDVIKEYLIYLCHITDRLISQQANQAQRQNYISLLINQVARQYQRNVEAVMGGGEYRQALLSIVNSRFNKYANCAFDGDQPGYSARRLLGSLIQDVMGLSQTNKWVIQQIIDIDSIDAGQQLAKGLNPLLDELV